MSDMFVFYTDKDANWCQQTWIFMFVELSDRFESA